MNNNFSPDILPFFSWSLLLLSDVCELRSTLKSKWNIAPGQISAAASVISFTYSFIRRLHLFKQIESIGAQTLGWGKLYNQQIEKKYIGFQFFFPRIIFFSQFNFLMCFVRLDLNLYFLSCYLNYTHDFKTRAPRHTRIDALGFRHIFVFDGFLWYTYLYHEMVHFLCVKTTLGSRIFSSKVRLKIKRFKTIHA